MKRTIPTALALLVLIATAHPANAQSEATLRAALQRAVVVEEQEHDLAAAERLYEDVASDAAAAENAQVRGEALLRLGELLLRLGKETEARAALEQAAALGGEIGERAQAALQGQGQEGEREQKLREKARGILEEVVEEAKSPGQDVLPGVQDAQALHDLLWIGAPAVPEVLRVLERLEAAYADLTGPTIQGTHWQITGMMSLLWKLGGEQAARYLQQVQQHELLGMRRAAAYAAHVADDPRMIEVAQGFLQDPDPEGQVPIAILSQSWQRAGAGFKRRHHDLFQSLPVREIVDLVDSEVAAVRVHVLDLLGSNWNELRHDPDPESTYELMVPKLRDALGALDPQVGQAAQRLLVSHATVVSAAGRSLLLEWIPRLDESLRPGWGSFGSYLPRGGNPHLEEVLRTARVLGPVEVQRSGNRTHIVGRHALLASFVERLHEVWGHDAMEGVLELVALGFEPDPWYTHLSQWVAGNAKSGDLLAVVRNLPHYGEPGYVLNTLDSPSLPEEAWPYLRDYASNQPSLARQTLTAIGWTGATEAADFLLQHLRANPESTTAVWGLLNLSHENQEEEVLAALREALSTLAPDSTGSVLHAQVRNAVFARLAQLGDVPAIELYPRAYALGLHPRRPHTVPSDEIRVERRGIQWLVPLDDGTVFHGYEEKEDLARAWRVLLEDEGIEEQVWSDALGAFAEAHSGSFFSFRIGGYEGTQYHVDTLPPISDPLRMTIAGLIEERASKDLQMASHPVTHALHNLAGMLSAATTDGTDWPARRLRTWTARMLSHGQPTIRYVVLLHLPGPAARMLQDEVEERLADEYPEITWAAVRALIRADLLIGEDVLERLLANPSPDSRARALREVAPRVGDAALPLVLPLLEDPDASVRAAACAFLGSTVQTDAVPPLLQALRDPEEEVRKAAAEALEQIRFYHDQKGHWARVFDGVDASSNAAAEKLLLQARPDQPRETRLMAIRSLGALGVPEALPFLIDYTASDDAKLARAARDAITAIHAKAGVK